MRHGVGSPSLSATTAWASSWISIEMRRIIIISIARCQSTGPNTLPITLQSEKRPGSWAAGAALYRACAGMGPLAHFPSFRIQSGRGVGISGASRYVWRIDRVPVYEYECRPLQHRFEVRHGYNDEPVTECQVCGGEVRRVIHPVGIVFKGSGFYATDSRSPSGSRSGDSSADGGSKSGSDSKSQSDSTSATDSKSESKSETKAERKSESAASE